VAWQTWQQRLPREVEEICRGWQLDADGEPVAGTASLVVPVRTREGARAVLKLGWPGREPEQEHLALRAWDGGGAVRLFRADPRRQVLLLERAEPGHDLRALAVEDACQVIAGLHAPLHRAPLPQLDRLSELAGRWAEELTATLLESRVAPRRFVEQAIGLGRELASDPGTDVALLHGDLHFENVLAAERDGVPTWLAVDPSPLTGDPAYEVAPVLWHRWDEAAGGGDLRAALVDRLYALVDGAGLDEDRVRAWVTVRMMVAVLRAVQHGAPDPEWITRCTTVTKAVQR
jgi:streptomycin 6-kinase